MIPGYIELYKLGKQNIKKINKYFNNKKKIKSIQNLTFFIFNFNKISVIITLYNYFDKQL
jgi:hypothetical protein